MIVDQTVQVGVLREQLHAEMARHSELCRQLPSNFVTDRLNSDGSPARPDPLIDTFKVPEVPAELQARIDASWAEQMRLVREIGRHRSAA